MSKKQHYSGIGGQAVLEGIMMRNKNMYATAVRKPDHEIEVDFDEYHGFGEGKAWREFPFIRGVFSFIDSLTLGIKTLNYSASFYEDDGKRDPHEDPDVRAAKDKVFSGIVTVISLVIAIGLFMVLPYVLSTFVSTWIRNASVLALLEGLIRIAIFLIYILSISAMPDIKRLYQYHGAEHKCINCIEHGKPLTVRNVSGSTRFHKRCGTSFIIIVMLVSVVVFFFIRVDSFTVRLLLRIALVPVIAGISFELLRLAGRSNNIVINVLSAPGLWMQHITTKEPDDDMIEVAIAAVEAVFDWREYQEREFGYDRRDLDDIVKGYAPGEYKRTAAEQRKAMGIKPKKKKKSTGKTARKK